MLELLQTAKYVFIFCNHAVSTTHKTQKPVAMEPKEIQECYKMCENKGVSLFCSFQRRVDPSFQALKTKVMSGELGELQVMNAIFRWFHATLSPSSLSLSPSNTTKQHKTKQKRDHPIPPIEFLGWIFFFSSPETIFQLVLIFWTQCKEVIYFMIVGSMTLISLDHWIPTMKLPGFMQLEQVSGRN